jgi:muramidase (phage lysozyme)
MKKRFKRLAIVICSTVVLGSILLFKATSPRHAANPTFKKAQTPQLVMTGGDPYIRALMRMISASEASDLRPYSIIYGGTHVEDLSRHPERCIRIVSGPNMDNCSTAAGRYQMINTTWAKMAARYHPHQDCVLFVFNCNYSFAAEYQDAVVYAWLNDEQAWKMNIAQLLKDGELERVRQRLSSTWTSLGYGIETNTVTPKLAGIYQQLIEEELEHQDER